MSPFFGHPLLFLDNLYIFTIWLKLDREFSCDESLSAANPHRLQLWYLQNCLKVRNAKERNIIIGIKLGWHLQRNQPRSRWIHKVSKIFTESKNLNIDFVRFFSNHPWNWSLLMWKEMEDWWGGGDMKPWQFWWCSLCR